MLLNVEGAGEKGTAPLDSAPLLGGHGAEGVELYRLGLDSDTILINRRRFILHPRSVKGSPLEWVTPFPRGYIQIGSRYSMRTSA